MRKLRDNREIREFKSSKYVILFVVFMLTAITTFISMNFEKIQPTATNMSKASLPTIAFMTSEGKEYNLLHGYTEAIDGSYVYGNITVLLDNRKLPVIVHTYGEEVSEIHYKIRNIKNNDLIENTLVTSYDTDGDNIEFTCNIKNLIDENTEYSFEIILKTNDYEEVHFYTRIITDAGYEIDGKMDFSLDFNECTFDSKRLSEIKTYLETSSQGNNNNYGKVNIYCSLEQVGWGNLEPQRETSPQVTLLAVMGDMATLRLDYRIAAVNDYGFYDSFKVSEYYRVRKTVNGYYLLDYERTTNQVFDAKNDLTSSGKINLGITSETGTEAKTDEKGVYTYFVSQGNLWCYNADSDTFTRIFSFEDEDTDGIRETYGAHRIKILNVSESGDCSFVVYGYMNRGEHEGLVGVSLCSYVYSSNDVMEKLFVKQNVTPEILMENALGVAFIRDEEFYFQIDEYLYSVDLVSKEVMVEVTGLKEGSFAVSEEGDAIAYSTTGDIYNTDTIRILNFGNDSDYEIKAEDGDTLKPLGYIKSDFVYGYAHKDDIYKSVNGREILALYKVEIVNSDYALIKEYEPDDIYVSDATMEDMRVTLTRLVKSEDGYSLTSIDQLINKDENNAKNVISTSFITTETRKQELCIELLSPVTTLTVSYRTSKEILFKEDSDIELDENFMWTGKYYVYGYGKFQGSFLKLEDAISAAYETYGTVLDSDAKEVWRKYKKTTFEIDGLKSEGCSYEDSLAYSVQMLADFAGAQINVAELIENGQDAVSVLSGINGITGINLSGISLDKVISYVGKNSPVIAKTDINNYVVVIAYDSSEITYIETATGREQTMTITAANKLFAQGGNVFVTFVK